MSPGQAGLAVPPPWLDCGALPGAETNPLHFLPHPLKMGVLKSKNIIKLCVLAFNSKNICFRDDCIFTI